MALRTIGSELMSSYGMQPAAISYTHVKPINWKVRAVVDKERATNQDAHSKCPHIASLAAIWAMKQFWRHPP
jgi:hypothetical protein